MPRAPWTRSCSWNSRSSEAGPVGAFSAACVAAFCMQLAAAGRADVLPAAPPAPLPQPLPRSKAAKKVYNMIDVLRAGAMR